MADATKALQTAVYAAFAADSTLSGLIAGRIYDHPHEDAAFPHVRIEDIQAGDWSTKTDDGQEVVLTVSSFTRDHTERGSAPVQDVMAAIDAIVQKNAGGLSPTGFNIVSALREFSQALPEADGLTWHGVQRFRLLVEDA